MTQKSFTELGVDETFVAPLKDQGIEHPFPIQELTLPLALGRHDVIGQARTGSGKTLGFGLPLLQHVDPQRSQTQALVVVPTRELCVQVTEQIALVGQAADIEVLSVYGGVPIDPQADTLRGGVHVVVGTPGRLLDHLRRRNLDLTAVSTLVLDEADEMLDMGFLPDVERLIDACPHQRHTMLFSATMPAPVVRLARRYLTDPTFVRADVEDQTLPENIEHHFFLVHKLDKPRVLARILQSPQRDLSLVFTRTKAMADRLVDELSSYQVRAVAIHGDLSQSIRERNLSQFRDSSTDVLVATEVAARGLDITDVSHVVNYDCPDDDKMYLHRTGRTARAGESGVAITFVTHAEVDRANMIRRGLNLTEVPVEEVFSTSELLLERFALPTETPWSHLASGRGSSSRSRSAKGGQARSDKRGQAKPDKRAPAKSAGHAKDEPAQQPTPAKSAEPTQSAETEPAEPAAATASSDGDTAAGARGGSRTRTRTRTRTRPSDETTAGGATSTSPADAPASETRGHTRARRDSGSRDTNGGRDGAERKPAARADHGTAEPRRSDHAANEPHQDREVETPTPEPGVTTAGAQARGHGRPLLTRTVRVEHLP